MPARHVGSSWVRLGALWRAEIGLDQGEAGEVQDKRHGAAALAAIYPSRVATAHDGTLGAARLAGCTGVVAWRRFRPAARSSEGGLGVGGKFQGARVTGRLCRFELHGAAIDICVPCASPTICVRADQYAMLPVFVGSVGWDRTSDRPINSRMLYR